MKKTLIYLIFVSAIALTGCSSAVKYSYDQNTDFKRYRTYSWSTVTQEKQPEETAVRNAKAAVNQQLAAKGLTEVSRDPDFYISLDIDRKLVWDKDNSYPDLRYRYQSYKSRGALVWSKQYEKELLALDFISAKSQKVIWHGSVKKNTDAIQTVDKEEKRIAESVSKILVNYPPSLAQE
jgi:hypothetical protein